MGYKFSHNSLQRLKDVDEQIQVLLKRSIAISPIDFGIPPYGGFRSEKEQFKLYNQGKSKCDGFKIKSRHQSGKAIDVFAYVDGKASWDKVHMAIIAGVILSEANRMKLNIRWGGTFGSKNFKGWDMPHFELKEKEK